MKLSDKLAELNRHGWLCKHSDKIHTIAGLDDKIRRCVIINGTVKGYYGEQSAYLSTEDDCVLICGVENDVQFAEFLRWIVDGDTKGRPAVKSTPIPGQKSLFD